VQLGDLRHMNATQLRQVVRNMSSKQDEQQIDAEAVAEESTEADSNTAAVPAIDESAAN
jgi:hypothetical protein